MLLRIARRLSCGAQVSGRRRKPGPRTKSGRLSRAYGSALLRDLGTEEGQAKRRALVGDDGGQTLACTAPGILFANGFLTIDQYTEALEYRRLWTAMFGTPWRSSSDAAEATEEMLVEATKKFRRMTLLLTDEQELAVRNICVFDEIPIGYIRMRKSIAGQASGDPLTDGLNALVSGSPRRAPRRARPLTLSPCLVWCAL
jgi:hypothetical protein